jgi:hypothetical protein
MHYIVLVIGDDPETQLEPFSCYNEDVLEFDLYETREDLLKQYNALSEEKKKYYENVDAYIEDQGYDQNEDDPDEFGHYINPNIKYDWYSFGGRWRGFLKLKAQEVAHFGDDKDGTKIVTAYTYPPHRLSEASWYSEGSIPSGYGDCAKAQDIDWEATLKTTVPVALLYEGEWLERDDFNKEGEWNNKVRDTVKDLPNDTQVSVYDLHY